MPDTPTFAVNRIPHRVVSLVASLAVAATIVRIGVERRRRRSADTSDTTRSNVVRIRDAA